MRRHLSGIGLPREPVRTLPRLLAERNSGGAGDGPVVLQRNTRCAATCAGRVRSVVPVAPLRHHGRQHRHARPASPRTREMDTHGFAFVL
jgi:hypothetical protein